MPLQAITQPHEAAPAPISRLPPELLSLISKSCDTLPERKATLRALCLVDKAFYKLAAAILYRRIDTQFGERLFSSLWNWRSGTLASRLMRTLETSPTVAAMVKALDVTLDSAERWVVPSPLADPDRRAMMRIPSLPNVRAARLTLMHGTWGRQDYSEGALLTLADAAPRLRVLHLCAFDGQLDTTLKKIAKLRNQFWEAWPKLEKLVVEKAPWERSTWRKKVAKDAEAWDVEIELV